MVHQPRLCRHIRGQSLQHQQRCPDHHRRGNPQSIANEVEGYDYTSGMLNTYSSFSQTYGYFEMRADMPTDRGAWPAFWLCRKMDPRRRNSMSWRCVGKTPIR